MNLCDYKAEDRTLRGVKRTVHPIQTKSYNPSNIESECFNSNYLPCIDGVSLNWCHVCYC